MPSSLQDSINDLLGLHRLGRYADMEVRARATLKSFAGTAILRELLGIALAAQRRFADALPHFERAARDHPGDPQFWDNLALCQCELKQYATAEQSLRRSLALQPGSIEALVALGRVLHLHKRHEEAREALERVLTLAPGHPAAHYHLGEALTGLDQLEQAEQHLRLALAAEPNVAATHNALASVLLRQGLHSQAEQSFRDAIVLDPTSPFSHANLALVLSRQGRDAEAADAARSALAAAGGLDRALDDDNLDLMDLIANVLDGGGATDEALQIFKAGIARNNEPRRAIWAIYAARRACDWDFTARLEPQACRIAEVTGPSLAAAVPRWRKRRAAVGDGAAERAAHSRRAATPAARQPHGTARAHSDRLLLRRLLQPPGVAPDGRRDRAA
jgi:Flp pilus assembly protein TadD